MIVENEFERLINEFHMILGKSKFGMNSPYARGKIMASLRNYKNEIAKKEWGKGFWTGIVLAIIVQAIIVFMLGG